MRIEDIEYTVEGTTMVGHLAIDGDQDEQRPGVLVCHEGGGLDDHAKGRAERLAGLGYAAFALDYLGGGRPLERDQMMERLGPLMADSDRIRLLGRAGLDVLLAQREVDPSKVAAIGYCFGGTMALELARAGTDLACVVGFHSGLQTSAPAATGDVKAPVLVCIGAEDPIVPPDQRAAFEEEMRAAGVDWRLVLYGGAAHSFTNPNAARMAMPGIEYNERADRRSWREMIDFFGEQFS